MPLSELNFRKDARLSLTLATATRLTGTDRSTPLKKPEFRMPNGITLPLVRLTRWPPRVGDAVAVRARPHERVRRQRIDADAADAVGQCCLRRCVVSQSDPVAVVRTGPQICTEVVSVGRQ